MGREVRMAWIRRDDDGPDTIDTKIDDLLVTEAEHNDKKRNINHLRGWKGH